MHTVLETSAFARRADDLRDADRDALITLLATQAFEGDLLVGMGGIRKLRFAPAGRGKRGAYRVVYYVCDEAMPILALFLFAKNEQADLTGEQRSRLLAIVAEYQRFRRP